jgi:hypothetical protein
VGALNDAQRLYPPRPERHGSAAVVRIRVVCSATAEAPADPSGRGDVPVERACYASRHRAAEPTGGSRHVRANAGCCERPCHFAANCIMRGLYRDKMGQQKVNRLP